MEESAETNCENRKSEVPQIERHDEESAGGEGEGELQYEDIKAYGV